MKVAFYAPLKATDHPVPSGDRTMARALVKALRFAGDDVGEVSRLRTFLAMPDRARQTSLEAEAQIEIERIAATWADTSVPDLWMTYHNHYKAPDLLGPRLSGRFGLPYVLVEASHAAKRKDAWTTWSAAADHASFAADLHLCFTPRDRDGLAPVANSRTPRIDLPPFIDIGDLSEPQRHPGPVPRLLTVAMMREGDKLASYRLLGEALAMQSSLLWRLTIVGDGPARSAVEEAFAPLPADRITWKGEMAQPVLFDVMAEADLFVWPGFGEAYGLAYLEAQATGLPVLALDVGGVASVVRAGETGVLVADATSTAFAEALGQMLSHPARLARMGVAASRFVRGERSLARAAARLRLHLDRVRSAWEVVRA